MSKKRNLWVNAIDKQGQVKNHVVKFLKRQGLTVYGVRSINAQADILTRPTIDWDVYSNNPKKTSHKLQKELDKIIGGDFFYNKPAMHKGTWKVKTIGDDLKRDTFDDGEVADFSIPDKKYPTKIINGVRYRILKEEINAKKRSVADKEMKFRHKKDRGDLKRIKENLKIKRLLR